MQKHIKPQHFHSFDRIIANWPDNTAQHQRARLLETVRLCMGITFPMRLGRSPQL